MAAKRWYTAPRSSSSAAPASARVRRRAPVDSEPAVRVRSKLVERRTCPTEFEAEGPGFALVDTLPQLIWVATAGGYARWFNKRWPEYTGVEESNLVGSGWYRAVHPDHAERVESGLRGSISRLEAWEDTFPLRGSEGDYRWFLSRGVPERDHVGNVVQWCFSGADVTSLYESEKRKDQFMGLMGHELRNPLAAIQTAVEILRMKSNEPDLGRAFAVLQRQTGQMTRLIQGLLEMSRISSGRVFLETRVLDLPALVDGVVDRHAELSMKAGVELKKSFPGQPVWVCGDRVRLEQVIGNLVDNAIKFNHPGGLVEVSVAQVGEGAVLRVRDSGAGMDEQTLSTVFQPHRRAQGKASAGIGLGLAIAKGLVDLHGGGIEARSGGPGAGSELTVHLPLSLEPGRSQIAYERSELQLAVLLVEDNLDAAQVLRELLELEGHHVRVAKDAPSALRILREQGGADAVLCDIGLPGMSGYDLARSIRQDAGLRGTYLCALTGYGSAADQRRAREAGFDLHLTKPVDVGVIQTTLAALR